MVQVILVTPGATDFDDQRRIVGNLDIPLNSAGADQAAQMANELDGRDIHVVYTAASQASMETAQIVADKLNVKCKTLTQLSNLDHGLWQGKLIDEVKATQRKVYRQWKEQPETVCPPEGEAFGVAQKRVKSSLEKLIKRNKNSTIALVVPEPLASLVHCQLTTDPVSDRWRVYSGCGSWQVVIAGQRTVDGRSRDKNGASSKNGENRTAERKVPAEQALPQNGKGDLANQQRIGVSAEPVT